MTTYRVNYYYLASGMEGVADAFLVGRFEAPSAEAAIEKAIDSYFEGKNRSWLRGCLTATEIKERV